MLCDIIDDKLLPDKRPQKMHFSKRRRLYYAYKDRDMNDIEHPYLLLFFNSKSAIYAYQRVINSAINVPTLGYVKLKMHEQSASPILQLCCIANLPVAGWITFENEEECLKTTYCDEEYNVKHTDLKPADKSFVPNPTVMSWDIEVNSSNPNVMPNATKLSDCIFQISCVFWKQGNTNDMKKYLLTLGEPDQATTGETVIIQTFPTEAHLVHGFSELIRNENPHIMIGYNIMGFDIPYLLDRADILNTSPSLKTIGMIRGKQCEVDNRSWSSSAYKNQNFKYIITDGRINLDMLSFVRREYKLSNYKLQTVATEFVGASKDPLTAKDIFKCYRIGMKGVADSSRALGIVGKYCVQDSVLVAHLFEKMDIWVGLTVSKDNKYVYFLKFTNIAMSTILLSKKMPI
jgi:DNA polymerase elongation subunit (family B)